MEVLVELRPQVVVRVVLWVELILAVLVVPLLRLVLAEQAAIVG